LIPFFISPWNLWKLASLNAGRGHIMLVQEGRMDWSQVEARWKQARGKIKQKWVRLTDEDLEAIEGRRERLERKIQERYGFATDHVRKEIEDWVRWQLTASPRRRNHKTKLPVSMMQRQRNRGYANWSVTAMSMP
jgi:uncharacterized protein YjbJ (UPF0337 family)